MTNDIDSNGYWTVDDYEALMGLAAYRYLAQQVGDAGEAQWATDEYNSLLAAVNTTLDRDDAPLPPRLPALFDGRSPTPRTGARTREDANWAAPFLFGRWAWDAQLFGAPVTGPAAQLIDATYAYGFGRLAGKLPADTFGGYPSNYYSTGYNAGYGSGGLASTRYRDQGILSYEFMITHTPERAVLVVGERVGAVDHVAVDREPPRGRRRIVSARVGHREREQGPARLARRPGGGRHADRGPRRPRRVADAGQDDLGHELPDHERQATRASRSRTGDRSVTLTLNGSQPARCSFELPLFVDNIAASSAGTIARRRDGAALGARADRHRAAASRLCVVQVRMVTAVISHACGAEEHAVAGLVRGEGRSQLVECAFLGALVESVATFPWRRQRA